MEYELKHFANPQKEELPQPTSTSSLVLKSQHNQSNISLPISVTQRMQYSRKKKRKKHIIVRVVLSPVFVFPRQYVLLYLRTTNQAMITIKITFLSSPHLRPVCFLLPESKEGLITEKQILNWELLQN